MALKGHLARLVPKVSLGRRVSPAHLAEMEILEEMAMWEVLARKEQQVHKVHPV